ncbi:MAG: glucose 1-dehydrogenase [Chloroflexi bacterium]|nr:glucose 1-dehydrogenase [Chloroflexota bacterium]
MPGRVDGRVALVTGGGSGIGRATALKFAAEGARVVVADIVPESAEETVRLIREAGGEAQFSYVDVTDEESVRSMVDLTVGEYGRLDCAHNNAGILGPIADMVEYSREDYDRVIAVNVTGVWLCMQAELRQMLTQDPPEGGHSIVNTASVAGLVGSPDIPAYSVSKHAVVGMTNSAARSYGTRGIRVNAVCPALIDTPLAAPMFERAESEERMRLRQAVGRFGEVEEVAALVVWLSSAEASFVTGTPVRVDGGALA